MSSLLFDADVRRAALMAGALLLGLPVVALGLLDGVRGWFAYRRDGRFPDRRLWTPSDRRELWHLAHLPIVMASLVGAASIRDPFCLAVYKCSVVTFFLLPIVVVLIASRGHLERATARLHSAEIFGRPAHWPPPLATVETLGPSPLFAQAGRRRAQTDSKRSTGPPSTERARP